MDDGELCGLKSLVYIAFSAFLAAVSAGGWASFANAQDAAPKSRDVVPFAKSYVAVGFARNYPVSFAQNRFAPGAPHPTVHYWHNLNVDWMMGLSAQFKIFGRESEEAERTQSGPLPIWSVSHDTMRIIRLDHPTYLLVGPKILYLLPARKAQLPVGRDSDYETEIGAAVSLAVVRIVDPTWTIGVHVDRWRGTRSMRFHGVEVGMEVGYALK